MKNLLFLLVGFLTTQATAQTSVYKISKGNRAIYLGGTVHILRASDYPLPAAFEQAYQKSNVITFETDTKNMQDPSVAQKIMAKGMYQDEQSLRTILADTTYEKLAAAFEKYKLPFEMMQKMKPALVVTTLSAIAMQASGMTAEGVDMYYTNKADVDKKEMQQLETIDLQIDRITSIGEGMENEFVNYSLDGLAEGQGDLEALIDNWRTGTSAQMDQEIITMKTDYPDMYTSLLVERNNNWMPKILSYLENGTKAFVLVGSLHLHGSDGLLALLKNQGYTIAQL